MLISGFTFVHNAINGGYPIIEAIRAVQPYVDEVVVVDCQSTDNTRQVLEEAAKKPVYDVYRNKAIPLRIIDGYWGNQAGETLRQAHSMYIECEGDVIVQFEGDEVYDDRLIRSIVSHIKAGHDSITVFRLQLEQNFQRCRWYPEPVHRVFGRFSGARKEDYSDHTTNQHEEAFSFSPDAGYLWDITNCFRDNWFNRVEQQARLRDTEPQYIMTPLHCLHKVVLTEGEAREWVYRGKHWTYTSTPFNIPEILKPLVGMTKYEPRVNDENR